MIIIIILRRLGKTIEKYSQSWYVLQMVEGAIIGSTVGVAIVKLLTG